MARRRRHDAAGEVPNLAPEDNARLARRYSGYAFRRLEGTTDDTNAVTLAEAMAYLQVPAVSVLRAVGGNLLDTSDHLRWK
eukprot:6390607-Alexandrium_andersonii.AAC.1